jgi:hypothetical protein
MGFVAQKTGDARVIPISSRQRAVLAMRTTDPHGQPFGPNAYVFGNQVGERHVHPRGMAAGLPEGRDRRPALPRPQTRVRL